MLQDLHDFIRQALKKRRSSFITAEAITDAINTSSRDLWRELIAKSKESGMVSSLLNPFKSNSTITSAGSYTASGKSSSEVIAAETGDIPVIIAHNDAQWASRRIPEGEDIDFFLTEGTFTSGSLTLPDTFLKAVSVNEGNYQGVIVPPDMFYSKDMLATFPEKLSDPNQLIHNIEVDSPTGDQLPHTLDEDFVFPISVEVEFQSGRVSKGYIVSPDVFRSKNILDILLNDRRDSPKNESSHPFFSPTNEFTPPQKEILEHRLLSRETYGTPTGTETLPDDFYKHVDVFYFTISSNTYEGQILDHDEFLDRVNSQILTPTLTEPIGTIYDNKLEVFPKAGMTSIILPYIKDFDETEFPIFTISGNTLKSRADYTVNDTVNFTYYKHPTSRRPVATVEGKTAKVRPATSTAKLKYIQFPSAIRPMIRYEKTGPADMLFEVKPSSFTSDIDVYFIDPPAEASHGAVTYTAGVPSALTSVVEPGWNNDAFGELASRALLYLGKGTQDQDAMQIEQIKNINEIQSPGR